MSHKIPSDVVEYICRLFDAGVTVRAAAAEAKIGKSAVERIRKKWKEWKAQGSIGPPCGHGQASLGTDTKLVRGPEPEPPPRLDREETEMEAGLWREMSIQEWVRRHEQLKSERAHITAGGPGRPNEQFRDG